MFWGEAVPSRTKNNKVLVLNLFTRTHITILNIKNWFSKLSIKMEKEKTRKTKEKNQKEEPERKRPMFTKCFLALRRRYLVKIFFIFMSDSCVRYEVGFVGYNSENVWCLVLLFSLAICKLFDWSKFVYSYIHIKKNAKISARLRFRWSTLLIWCLGNHSCIFDKLSGEVSDLKLFKNVKVMFIFNTKLVS